MCTVCYVVAPSHVDEYRVSRGGISLKMDIALIKFDFVCSSKNGMGSLPPNEDRGEFFD